MKRIPLMLALLGAIAAAPAAMAQDSSDNRFAIVGGYALSEPTGDATIGAADADLDGEGAATLSASWYATDNIAVEAWGAADKFGHRVNGPNGKIGSVDAQPYALSGQYHFGQPDMTFRPFVGLGVYESNISDEDIAQGGDHVGLDTPRGAIGTVGVDVNITPTWFARADARYMRARSDVNVAGQPTGEELKLDPWTVGIGLGARF